MDVDLLELTWDHVASYGDEVPLHFYSSLFQVHPELRPLFPARTAKLRVHLLATLNMTVRSARNLDAVTPRLQRLGRDHRGFGAIAEHYPLVVDQLLDTLEHFLGAEWTDDIAATWREALELVADVMQSAAAEAEKAGERPSWSATVFDAVRSDDFDHLALHLAVGDGFRAVEGDVVTVSLPDRPGSRRAAVVAGWGDRSDLLEVGVATPFDDGAALVFTQLNPGDEVFLSAPILEPVEGGPDGR